MAQVRMKKGAGKKSSPHYDIRPERCTGQLATELLELLWLLEATVEGYSEEAKLLERQSLPVAAFRLTNFPAVPNEIRKPLAARSSDGELLGDQWTSSAGNQLNFACPPTSEVLV